MTKIRSTRRLAASAGLALVLCAGGVATAQSITTQFTGVNGGNAGGINYFDVAITNPSGLTITGFDVNTTGTVGLTYGFTVYTCPGSYIGNEQNAAAWTERATGTFIAAGQDLHSNVTISAPFDLTNGSTQGMAIKLVSPGQTAAPLRYTTGAALGTFSNADISLNNVGAAQNVPFTAAPFTPRIWNGTIYYAVTGASGTCCFPNGTCQSPVTATACSSAGGVFHPEWANCAAASCPAAGSCCKGDGTCAPLTQAACNAVANSTWTASATPCTGVTCTGACCNTDGTCSNNISKNACLAAAGIFGGSATTCAGVTCAPAGACCRPDNTCANLTKVACDTARGFWGGAASSCATTPSCAGACCSTGGACSSTTWTACATAGSTFRSHLTTCGTAGCAPQLFFDDGRADNSIGYNAALSTTWCTKFVTVAGQDRITHIRAAFGTAASLNGKTATAQLFADGTAPGNPSGGLLIPGATITGTISGAGVGPNPTPLWVDFDIPDTTIATGTTFYAAITVPNCVIGDFPGGADNSTNATGRCWITNQATGTVPAVMPAVADITPGLLYSWMIRVDTADSTGSIGACCKVDGTCSDIAQAACSALSGIWNFGLACTAVTCPPPGQCCSATGTCSNVVQTACTSAGSTWTGGSNCSSACPVGACCFIDGTCQQLLAAACTSSGGTFTSAGTSCVAAACPQPGACCLPGAGITGGGGCIKVTQAECTAAGGVFSAGSCGTGGCWTVGTLYNNGSYLTHTFVGFNGADISLAPTGSLTTGFGWSDPGNLRIADDFTIPAGEQWTITKFRTVGYQTAFTNTAANPYTSMEVRIWDRDPRTPGATVVFGDTSTNLLDPASPFSNVYRIPAGTGFTDNQRPLYDLRANLPSVVLTPGTYFVEYSATNGVNPFMPPVTTQGYLPFGNAISTVTPPWGELRETGFQTANWSLVQGKPVGMPFILEGTKGPITATCYANCDQSTAIPVLNVADFTCFLTKYAAGSLPYANCDNSTAIPVLNVADFTCFLTKFAGGCS